MRRRTINYDPGAASFTFTGSGAKTASGAHTYAGFAAGAADPRRVIAVSVGYISTAVEIPSLTIDGVPASKIVGVVNSDSRRSEIWAASVPTGATVSIVIGAITGTWRSNVAVHSLYGIIGVTPKTTTDVAASPSLTLAEYGGGVALVSSYLHVGTANAVTWTGAAETSDVYDTFSGLHTTASRISSSSPGTYTVTANGTVTSAATVAASFR